MPPETPERRTISLLLKVDPELIFIFQLVPQDAIGDKNNEKKQCLDAPFDQ